MASTRVGPYRILRLINRGGQGGVYLGYDERLRRRVAIKIRRLPPQRADRKRLLQEARLIASIDSAKVVRIHDIIESGEYLAMVMEYVPGCDLEEFLAVQVPSLASVLTVGADVAGALAAARQQHVVHADLKAGNVLISEQGRVKLTDFGIALDIVVPKSRQSGAGSLSALSPEQYLGRPMDVRSDLFSLGCLLYRMLSSKQPFYRRDQLDTAALLRGSPPPLRDVVTGDVELPDELVQLVADLLQADPSDRPGNTHHVRQVLRKLSAEIPLAARNSLLRQAQPFFRPESEDDIPAKVPTELAREGRSSLLSSQRGISGLWRTLRPRSRRGRAAAIVLSLAVSCAAAWGVLRDAAPVVYITEPTLQIGPGAEVPASLSAGWLVDEVAAVLGSELSGAQILDAASDTRGETLYADGEGARHAPLPPDQLHIRLRCSTQLCVLTLSRHQDSLEQHRQVMLFPDMPLDQWRQLLGAAALELYR